MPGAAAAPTELTHRTKADSHVPSATEEAKLLAINAKHNTVGSLLNPRRHSDHKFFGLAYIIFFFATVYRVIFDIDDYEKNFWFHMSVPLLGCGVTLAALRNFHFLPKKNENPGMFAAGRTFSYAFVQENLFFQFALGTVYISNHPLSGDYIDRWMQFIVLFTLFYVREAVPKTSYVSWEQGNEKVNAKKTSEFWLFFVNAQVKIVRWNFVLKKALLFYLFLCINLEWLFSLPEGSFVTQFDRQCCYLLNLDAMHNVTTAFFLQTLKFKGFISAEMFSFLFNVSPFCGAVVTYQLLTHHAILWPAFLACVLETGVNLSLIYPSKMSNEWKNRTQVTFKGLCVVASTYYLHVTRYSA